MRLSELKLGEKAFIKGFGDSELVLKLHEMGCLPGESVVLERRSPFGDPIAIKVAGYLLSLRKEEAEIIEVEICNE